MVLMFYKIVTVITSICMAEDILSTFKAIFILKFLPRLLVENGLTDYNVGKL